MWCGRDVHARHVVVRFRWRALVIFLKVHLSYLAFLFSFQLKRGSALTIARIVRRAILGVGHTIVVSLKRARIHSRAIL
jgi:hypothetical protein